MVLGLTKRPCKEIRQEKERYTEKLDFKPFSHGAINMEWSSVLAEVPGGQLVATFPSDVQFDGMDKVSSKEYPMLQGQVSDILKTVTLQ